MCGIAGFLRGHDGGGSTAAALLDALAHRGPDGGWVADVADLRLVQTRLAVIDLSDRVRYPMSNESGDLWLLFNGEIYNHRTLRAELERRGHRFATDCDAEVVLHGWEEWAEGVLPRLMGMWAFAVVDAHGEVVLARDRFGIKPLVRTTGDSFAFGSDVMALVAAGLSGGEVDHEALAEFTAFHYVPPPRTGIRDVRQVEPGTYLRRRPDGSETQRRWATPLFTAAPARNVTVDELDETLAEVVSRQLVADVGVGVFLSGGIDSALILHYAVAAGASPVALTVGFPGTGGYDETQSARKTAAALGVRHEITEVPPEFAATLGALRAAYDVPLADPSAVATLPLAALARRHVTVALSGTGGDDLFGGYLRHRAVAMQRPIAALPQPLLRVLASHDPGRGGERKSAAAQIASYAARLARGEIGTGRDLYLGLVAASTGAAARSTLRNESHPRLVADAVAGRLGLRADLDLDGAQEFELRTYVPGDLLVKEDRATMAYSVEGRVPLLDEAVVELARCTRTLQRVGPTGGKRILRQVARRRLSSAHGRARKRGFAVPLKELFDGPWHADAREWLGDRASELVDGAPAAALLDDATVPALDIWMLVALGAWEERLHGARKAAARATAA